MVPGLPLAVFGSLAFRIRPNLNVPISSCFHTPRPKCAPNDNSFTNDLIEECRFDSGRKSLWFFCSLMVRAFECFETAAVTCAGSDEAWGRQKVRG